MLLVRLYLNGDKHIAGRTRNTLAASMEDVLKMLAGMYEISKRDVTIIPHIIATTELPLSKNLPDVIFELQACTEHQTSPYADRIRDNLLNCPGFATMRFVVTIHGRTDLYAFSRYTPGPTFN